MSITSDALATPEGLYHPRPSPFEKGSNVGIKAIETYFPSTCVDQSQLEKHDGVAEGKYTIGLGQRKMSFCDDREDIYSMALTAVASLLKKYHIDRRDVGRLEVGTETLLDKSKSVKSVLMQLFSEVNTNICGVDNINACYGGTNALFNAVDWCESSAWDGRYAIVVAGDIAVYSKGAARPTGGAGVVAMLIGHDAPIALQPGLRGSYFQHAYDFYKPDLRSEYPVVDGQYSMECYTRALDACYDEYKRCEERLARYSAKGLSTPSTASDSGIESPGGSESAKGTVSSALGRAELATITDRFDHMVFHSPVAKLVGKSYGRLAYNDFKCNPKHVNFAHLDPAIASCPYEESLTDKKLEKAFTALTASEFRERVEPSTLAPVECGNTYTGSLYAGLASLIAVSAPASLEGKSVGMFSYGSGLASTMFSLRIRGDTSEMRANLDLPARLDARRAVPAADYERALKLREEAHLQKSFAPVGGVCGLAEGTYYLTGVDEQYRRGYAIA